MEARESDELLVLLTPTAILSSYIWMEVGLFWAWSKRIVGVLYNISERELASHSKIPILLKGKNSVDLSDIDTYFTELKGRIEKARSAHV